MLKSHSWMFGCSQLVRKNHSTKEKAFYVNYAKCFLFKNLHYSEKFINPWISFPAYLLWFFMWVKSALLITNFVTVYYLGEKSTTYKIQILLTTLFTLNDLNAGKILSLVSWQVDSKTHFSPISIKLKIFPLL